MGYTYIKSIPVSLPYSRLCLRCPKFLRIGCWFANISAVESDTYNFICQVKVLNRICYTSMEIHKHPCIQVVTYVQTLFSLGWHLSIRDYKHPFEKVLIISN